MNIKRLAGMVQAFEDDLQDSLNFLKNVEYKSVDDAVGFTTVISTIESLDRATRAAGDLISTMAMVLALCDPGPPDSPANEFMQRCLDDENLAPQMLLIQTLILDCIEKGLND